MAQDPSPASGSSFRRLPLAAWRRLPDPDAVTKVLATLAAALVLAGVLGQLSRFLLDHDHVFGLVPLFHLDEEGNVPAVFSVGLMLAAAALLARIAWLKWALRDRDAPRWVILAIGFVLMAIDEGWSMHETLVAPMRSLLGSGRLGIFHFAWVIPGIGIVLALVPYYIGFLRRLPGPTRRRFLVAAALFLGGAIGMELLGGYYAEANGRATLVFEVLVAIEEGLEMAGLIVMIRALMLYSWPPGAPAETDSRAASSGR